jgi:hypothetical protein
MNSLDPVRGVKGKPVDPLPAQPIAMMFAAKHAGFRYTHTPGTLDSQIGIREIVDRFNVAETRSTFQCKGEANGV